MPRSPASPPSPHSRADASASDINAARTATLNVNTIGPSDKPLSHDSELSEAQLRRLYDEQEVNRFMNVFSAYVTEVRVPGASDVSDNIQSALLAEYGNSSGHDGSRPLETQPLPPRPPAHFPSERIARTYVLPYLPLASRTSPPFTIKRLRLTTQRLYLATVPPYQAFLLNLAHLALWKDRQRSTVFCICFWTLWFYDLLLPALMFRILWSLLRRRLLPYPSLKELQERQQDAARARRFGEELQERLSSSTVGPKDIWTLFKTYRTSTRNRETVLTASGADAGRVENEPTVPEYGGSEEELDLRRDLLQFLNEVADIHERIKNIFTWRRPSVSRRYAYLLTVTAFGVLFLPAHYIFKLMFMSGGIIFWHVIPIIAALQPVDRARVPAAFADAPTDSEYAIELITKRMLSGENTVLPASRSHSNNPSTSSSAIDLAGTSNESDVTLESQSYDNGGINWRKWGTRVAHGKSWINDGKQLISADRGTGGRKSFESLRAPPPRDVGTEQTFTFPAQYATAPGLITLTSDTIYFTSLTATHAKLVIPCAQLRRVKKIGLVKGLSMTWLPTEPERNGEREEKFHWGYGGREYEFASVLANCASIDFALGFGLALRLWLHRKGSRTYPRAERPRIKVSLPFAELPLSAVSLAMFFSTDLLSKRDSGFGLLWLAATLGSKSAFRKLPKRSVMTADISQLCELIAAPTEPLALRLSSNLMVGAARVYKVKQEIFISDVTMCFNSLKRVIQEVRSMAASDAQLQMLQPTVKASVVTLCADPNAALLLDFDNMVVDWDEYLDLEGKRKDAGNKRDDEYDPKSKKRVGKRKAAAVPPPSTEAVRANAHVLDENHEFLLANSFDTSLGGSGIANLSAFHTAGFGFDDTFWAFDGLDVGEGVGDDFVRELGEGWGASPTKENTRASSHREEKLLSFGSEGAMDYDTHAFDGVSDLVHNAEVPIVTTPGHQDIIYPAAELPQSSSLTATVQSHVSAHNLSSPPEPDAPLTDVNQTIQESIVEQPRKAKRGRLLLDPRTELTDEELKAARAHYLEEQNAIRRELEIRRFEKENGGFINNLLWSAPGSVQAKELVDFWVDHFKAQVEARSGLFVEHHDDLPRLKRRRIGSCEEEPQPSKHPNSDGCHDRATSEHRMDVDYDANWGDADDFFLGVTNLRSSEEPGQGRGASHPPSVFGNSLRADGLKSSLGFQRSSLFPWDNAGISSSVTGEALAFNPRNSNKISVDQADAKLRGSSASHRGSSLPSYAGSLQAGAGSPGVFPGSTQLDDDFAFDVPENSAAGLSVSEGSPFALEKNSNDFLEYARMQYRCLTSSCQFLSFDDVVPKATSTAHVAAAALYHCLVLGTKDLVQLHQQEPYGIIEIRIK